MPVNASEGPRLTDEERDEVLRVGVATVNGAVPVVAGASGISIEHCIERARVAVECGADSIIAMPCNGMGGGQETIDLFGTLADATGLPVWLQNNKPPTGPTIPTPTIIKIIEEIPTANLAQGRKSFARQRHDRRSRGVWRQSRIDHGRNGWQVLVGGVSTGRRWNDACRTHHRSTRRGMGCS